MQAPSISPLILTSTLQFGHLCPTSCIMLSPLIRTPGSLRPTDKTCRSCCPSRDSQSASRHGMSTCNRCRLVKTAATSKDSTTSTQGPPPTHWRLFTCRMPLVGLEGVATALEGHPTTKHVARLLHLHTYLLLESPNVCGQHLIATTPITMSFLDFQELPTAAPPPSLAAQVFKLVLRNSSCQSPSVQAPTCNIPCNCDEQHTPCCRYCLTSRAVWHCRVKSWNPHWPLLTAGRSMVP